MDRSLKGKGMVRIPGRGPPAYPLHPQTQTFKLGQEAKLNDSYQEHITALFVHLIDGHRSKGPLTLRRGQKARYTEVHELPIRFSSLVG